MDGILAILLLGLLISGLAPWACRFTGRFAGAVLALYPAGVILFFLNFAGILVEGETVLSVVRWIPSFGIHLSFMIDGLSLLFVLLICGIGVLVLIYAEGYLRGHPHLGRFFSFTLLFMVSMLGLVLADNVISLFVFWELTSFSSYLLIGFNHESPRARSAALQALLVTGGGGLALLAGLLLFAHVAGSLELSVLLSRGDLIHAHSLYLPVLLLVLIGVFTKSAQFPFHFWLPNAMEAPSPVSAYLHSATMVKAGIYLLARFNPLIGDTEASHYIITVTGAVTMLLGAVAGFLQKDLKRILAYSTVSALGMLTLLLGLGTTLAVKAAMVFLVVHSLYKGALFLMAGGVDHETGVRNVDSLGGLARSMPVTAVCALFAGLSMAGLPPMLGFISKELLYEAKLQAPNAEWLITSGGVLANVIIVGIAGLVVVKPFWGQPVPTPNAAHEPPWSLLAGPVVLSLLGFLIGLFPNTLSEWLISPAVSAVRAEYTEVKLALWHGINPVLALSVMTVTFGVVLYVLHPRIRRTLEGRRAWFPWRAEEWYDRSVSGMVAFARLQTRVLQNGHLRMYLLTIIAALLGLAGYAFVTRAQIPDIGGMSAVEFHEAVLALVIIAATVMTVTSRSRLVAIAGLGIVGYGIAVLFILFGAPDLAMTQFSIETLSVVLFVLVLMKLPRFADYGRAESRMRDLSFAAAAGLLMAGLVVTVASTPLTTHVASYFAESSYLLAKGRNIVNVILVDFRGMDTLGEITVLALAAIGSYALLKLLPHGDDDA